MSDTHNNHNSDYDSDSSGDDKPATKAWLKKYLARRQKKFREVTVPKILKEVEEEWKGKHPVIVETEQGLAVMTVAEAKEKGLKEKSVSIDRAQEEELHLPTRSKDEGAK